MKKIILISSGALFILILIGIWAYIFLFGTPEQIEDMFANFDSDTSGVVQPSEPEDGAEGFSQVTDGENVLPLRQITTVPVAGFAHINAQTDADIMYVEQGTGHIYTYNAQTSSRDRISNLTIAQAHSGYITNDGSRAVVMNGYGSSAEMAVIRLQTSTSSEVVRRITGLAENVSVMDSGHLVYSTVRNNQATAIALNLETLQEQTLFSTPFPSITVLWGDTPQSTHYVYPKSAARLMSYVYRVNGNTLRRIPIEGFGLNVIRSGNQFTYSRYPSIDQLDNPQRVNYSYTIGSDSTTQISTTVTPEKCVYTNTNSNLLWCGYDLINTTQSVSDWHKGLGQFNDSLWLVNLETGTSRLNVNIEQESGRQVDIDKIKISENDSALLFRNRTNGTLWLYETN